MKKILVFLLILTLSSITVFASDSDISVFVNDVYVEYDTPPAIFSGRTMVPIRQTAEALGAKVMWNDVTKKATISIAGRVVEMTQDNPYMYINGIRILMDTETTNINGRIYIPVRYLSEALDASVIWDGDNRIVEVITSRDYVTIAGTDIVLGDPVSIMKHTFGKPTRIDSGSDRFEWYVYANDLSKFMMIGVLDGKIISIYTAFSDFTLNGTLKYGDVLATDPITPSYRIYTDSLNGNTIYGVWIGATYSTDRMLINNFTNARATVEQQISDITNAFRFKNNLPILTEDTVLTQVCRNHSQDMANNNYLSHTNSQNQSPWDRYESAGGKYYACTENIAAGAYAPPNAFDAWFNSENYRKNLMHAQATFTGVGIGYNPNSDHDFYTTQMFSYQK